MATCSLSNSTAQRLQYIKVRDQAVLTRVPRQEVSRLLVPVAGLVVFSVQMNGSRVARPPLLVSVILLRIAVRLLRS